MIKRKFELLIELNFRSIKNQKENYESLLIPLDLNCDLQLSLNFENEKYTINKIYSIVSNFNNF